MTKKQTVQIAEAKGRPMLHWVGKRTLDHVTAFPAQLVETFNPAGEETDAQGLLFHGDNKDVLAWLLANGYRGKVNLIYIDPPFDSGADYVRRVQLRGVKGSTKLEGETYTLGEQIQYTDIWANDTYLQFMYERLLLLKELLAKEGSIFLHLDYRRVHYLKCIADEIFGLENIHNEVIWCYSGGGIPTNELPRKHDNILWYSKTNKWTYHVQYRPYSEGTLERGRTAVKGEHAQLRPEGTPINDWWTDIEKITSPTDPEKLYFPTQKSEALLTRIITMASSPGDLVLDCFVGSGTTAAVAQKLGRRWIAGDINKGAVQTTSKRLQAIIGEQIEAGVVPQQGNLNLEGEQAETDESPPPVALSFSAYRVNDYDLQIQHNEAVNLAVEMIGIERVKTDVFFDGTLGRRLVKIVPFNHPLTPLDLQLVQDEFKARPDEERDVVLVCLGQEMAVDAWLEEYNKRRPVNKIEVIELRTDQKYGKFFVHQPAQAQVQVERQDGKVVVEIEDFISPTIVERLEMDTPLFKAQIPDWRAMVDVVLIDTGYHGKVFNITLSDVPERKNDLVSGRYELDAPDGPTAVAVKIIDMLGEEVLVTAEV